MTELLKTAITKMETFVEDSERLYVQHCCHFADGQKTFQRVAPSGLKSLPINVDPDDARHNLNYARMHLDELKEMAKVITEEQRNKDKLKALSRMADDFENGVSDIRKQVAEDMRRILHDS